MTDAPAPTTKEGHLLHGSVHFTWCHGGGCGLTRAIRAIENEAREQGAQDERERIATKARAAHDLFEHGSIVMRHAVSGSWEACDTQPCRWVRALLSDPQPDEPIAPAEVET